MITDTEADTFELQRSDWEKMRKILSIGKASLTQNASVPDSEQLRFRLLPNVPVTYHDKSSRDNKPERKIMGGVEVGPRGISLLEEGPSSRRFEIGNVTHVEVPI